MMQRCKLPTCKKSNLQTLCNLDSPFLCYSLLDGGCHLTVFIEYALRPAFFAGPNPMILWANAVTFCRFFWPIISTVLNFRFEEVAMVGWTSEIDGRHGIRHDSRKILSTTWETKEKKRFATFCFRFFSSFQQKIHSGKPTLANGKLQTPFFQIDVSYCFKWGMFLAQSLSLCSFFPIGKIHVLAHLQTNPPKLRKPRLYLLPCNHSLRHHDLHLTSPQEPNQLGPGP